MTHLPTHKSDAHHRLYRQNLHNAMEPRGSYPVKHKHRASTVTSILIILVGTLTWLSFVDVANPFMDPRKLMADEAQTSTGGGATGHQVTLGGAILLRKEPFFNSHQLQEVNVTVNQHASNTRVVYLHDDETSWQQQYTGRNYSVSIYPKILSPNKEHSVESSSDGEATGSMEDLTRWYPQIGSEDEAFHIERRLWPRHEIDPDNCKPSADWQSKSFPICNTIHEKDLVRDIVQEEMDMVSKKGFWRRAWGSYDTAVHHNDDAPKRKMVWKIFKIHHSMEDAFFENNRVDALAMERLTASPHVIDIYGYCAMTNIQEFAGRQIHEQPLSPMESLDLAIQIARGLEDIHYIDNASRPVMVHNDINLANILVTDDGRAVINDFNIAVLLMERAQPESATCPFYSRFPNPQWRSPEEQVESEEESKTNPPIVDEKIDIYAMGNVLYRLVAGGSPWKKKGTIKLSPEEKIQVALAKKYNGSLPVIPDHVDLDNRFTHILHQAMEMCYRFHPRDRPTAKELVLFLETGRSVAMRLASEASAAE